MSKICILTKKKKMSKNAVSHSNIKKKIFCNYNSKKIKIWKNSHFSKINISTNAIKIIKKCLF